MGIELTRAAPYHIFINQEEFWPYEKIYVMNQFLPNTQKEWETFFSIIEDKKMIYKARVPKESIIKIEGGRITSEGELVTTIVWPFNQHGEPLVKDWLVEVKDILWKTGLRYRNFPLFKDIS